MVSSVALAKEDFSQQVRSYGWQANFMELKPQQTVTLFGLQALK